jgi:SPP1 family predicted phage head-tail adaptor
MLNRRCTLQSKQAGVDAIGQPVDAWTDVLSFWGHIKVTSGYEIVKANATVQVNRVNIRSRYMLAAFADAGMRVVQGGRTYNVEAVLPDDAGREYVDLVCEVLE